MSDVVVATEHGEMPVHVAVPDGPGPWPGVVLVHDFTGMSQDLRHQADWLAGEGFLAATASVVIKTLVLYTIMVTGSIWEKVVFGRWLFAPAFFWEDVFSMLVLALHTAYLAVLVTGALEPRAQMLLALAAYAAYVVNAAQFVWKLRLARLDETLRLAQPPLGAAR